jgi:hypothetical protein
MKHPTLICALAAAGFVGCVASSPAPKQAQLEARNAVIAAQKTVEPSSADTAKVNLARAQEDLRTGDHLVAKRKNETARLYYERATAQATAADAIAGADATERKALQMEARLEQRTEVESDVD